jgi:hypothetical protein
VARFPFLAHVVQWCAQSVEVPTFVTCSKNGSIASKLPTNMLSKMDDYCLFDHSNRTNPFLLCDEHGSWFEEPFLESPIGLGLVVLKFHMACLYGSSETVQSTMGHSRLRVRRQRQIHSGVAFITAYLRRSSAVTSS